MREDMFQPEIETMSRDQLAALQLDRLKAVVKRVYGKNPAYRELFQKAGVAPSDIRDLSDLSRLPGIDKESLRLAYPAGFLCDDIGNIREMHMSSGSTGTPIAMLYTQDDLEQWAECMARC
ncbi:MAG: phenylacetate--CoA ligase family protein, partial [Planctomycetota bacterium]|nr:phenylacetate--CoA ligase family protein [Planctomycetota bacterium]